jgi:hypothetical protein
MRKVNSWALIALIWMGCGERNNPIGYAEDADNGLKKEITIGKIHYKVQYKPADYIIATENPDSAQKRQRQEQLKGMVWFNISFSVDGYNQSPLRYQIADLNEYTQRQDYYLNQAAKDIYLLYGKDTLYVDSYWFENNQNLTPYETMIVGFKLPVGISEPAQDLKLSYYDRIFKNGIIKAIIKKEDL